MHPIPNNTPGQPASGFGESGLQSTSELPGLRTHPTLACLLTLPGWFLASQFPSVQLTIAASLISTLICVAWLYPLLATPTEFLRLLRLSGLYLILIQNMAWLFSSGIHHFELNRPLERTLTLIGTDLQHYSLAMLFISLFASISAAYGSLPIVRKLEDDFINRVTTIRQASPQILWILLFTITISTLALIASGILGNRSINVEREYEGQILLIDILVRPILLLQIPLAILLLQQIWENSRNWIAIGIVFFTIAVNLFAFYNQGRSPFVLAILLHPIWFAIFSLRRLRILPWIIAALVAFPLLSEILIFSNYIRSGLYRSSNWRAAVTEVLPRAWQAYRSSEHNKERITRKTTLNYATRPLLATTLARCIELPPDERQFLYGKDLIHSAIWVIPRAIFPDKVNFKAQEALLFENFELGRQADIADSMYLSAYIEWGWFGWMIQPLTLLAFWTTTLTIATRLNLPSHVCLLFAAIWLPMFLLSINEGSIMGWFSTMRTVGAIAVLTFPLSLLPGSILWKEALQNAEAN